MSVQLDHPMSDEQWSFRTQKRAHVHVLFLIPSRTQPKRCWRCWRTTSETSSTPSALHHRSRVRSGRQDKTSNWFYLASLALCLCGDRLFHAPFRVSSRWLVVRCTVSCPFVLDSTATTRMLPHPFGRRSIHRSLLPDTRQSKLIHVFRIPLEFLFLFHTLCETTVPLWLPGVLYLHGGGWMAALLLCFSCRPPTRHSAMCDRFATTERFAAEKKNTWARAKPQSRQAKYKTSARNGVSARLWACHGRSRVELT